MERWDTLWDGGWTFCFDDSAFMPSTDSFLLGSFPPLRQGWRVCDLGAGTGLLGLLLLAREPALTVTGLELSPDACELAARTAAANGLTDRLVTLPCDLRERSQLPAAGSFDLAVRDPCRLQCYKTELTMAQRIAAMSLALHAATELFTVFDSLW